ncbi:Peroxidase, family 2-domain-containing protein [Podospora conica]|nr:Peroxidase, family 2-domain-containing protein [Schizothecium conicum]
MSIGIEYEYSSSSSWSLFDPSSHFVDASFPINEVIATPAAFSTFPLLSLISIDSSKNRTRKMKIFILLIVGVANVALGGAKPRFREPRGHGWMAPGPNDSRSPCPGLNVMANHGYLPRNSRDIDLNDIRNAVSGAYNYAPTAFDEAFQQAVEFKLTTTGNASTIHLADLAKHDDIEFDGSLSRNDIFFGDNLHFDASIWAMTAARLRLYDIGPGNSERYVTVEAAAKAQAARNADAKKVNPTFNASAAQMIGGPGTTALYLTTLWDDKAGAVPKSWIRVWFESERIPYREGYQPPKTPRTGETIGNMFKQVASFQAPSA